MSHDSSPDLLVLHAVRITGFADTATIVHRFGLDPLETDDRLRDAEARGWTTYHAFGGTAGWSLTEHGRAENERRLASELIDVGCVEDVRGVHRGFLPLNALLLRACTDWQLKPVSGDRLVPNDHADRVWDAGVLRELVAIDRALRPLVGRLAERLTRFRGYDTRFSAALMRARDGEPALVDGMDVDSCHRIWFELHEDLIATLGIDRNA